MTYIIFYCCYCWIKKGSGDNSKFLTRVQFESTFKYLNEYFAFERTRFRSQKRSFYSHWSVFSRQLAKLFSALYLNYFDKYIVREIGATVGNLAKFEANFDSLFNTLIDLYRVWIEPSSVLEITSSTQINVKEVYEQEISTVGARDELINSTFTQTTPKSAVLLMIDSFLETFNTLLQRVNLFSASDHSKTIGYFV